MAKTSGTPFAFVAALARQLAATSKRLEKRRLIGEFLPSLNRDEVSPAVLLIVGRIFPEADPKALNVGWATLQKALGATRQARLDARPLTILDVRRAFEEIAAASGPDSVRVRQRLLQSLLCQATREGQEILEEHGGTTAVEYKFDGARIQIHRDGDRVKVFSRRLSDVTKSVPEVVEIARSLRTSSCVLEGEVVAIDERGRPRPFQELMRRFRRA